MRVYLDNCCYNRPFDDQGQAKIRVETEAKLLIQLMMWFGKVEYVWSFMLDIEVKQNPDEQHRKAIKAWRRRAMCRVKPSREIRSRAKELQTLGIFYGG